AFLGFDLRAAFFGADFIAAPFSAAAFFFFFAATTFLPRFAFFVFALDFFAFFAIIDLPIVVADHPNTHAGTAANVPCNAGGTSPPVAQSISSTGWTTGITVPAAICVMQPTLPAAITSGLSFSILPTLRSRNLLASSGWRIL